MHSCKNSFASKIESLDRSWPILKKLLIFWNYNYVAESISGKLISNTILTPECRYNQYSSFHEGRYITINCNKHISSFGPSATLHQSLPLTDPACRSGHRSADRWASIRCQTQLLLRPRATMLLSLPHNCYRERLKKWSSRRNRITMLPRTIRIISVHELLIKTTKRRRDRTNHSTATAAITSNRIEMRSLNRHSGVRIVLLINFPDIDSAT